MSQSIIFTSSRRIVHVLARIRNIVRVVRARSQPIECDFGRSFIYLKGKMAIFITCILHFFSDKLELAISIIQS